MPDIKPNGKQAQTNGSSIDKIVLGTNILVPLPDTRSKLDGSPDRKDYFDVNGGSSIPGGYTITSGRDGVVEYYNG